MAEASRLFFALWPDAQTARGLADCAPPELQARSRVPVEHLHLTLLFLGAVEPRLLPRIREAGDRSRGPSFVLSFDHTGQFAQAEVAWVGALVPDALRELVLALRHHLDGALPLRMHEFVAHVTFARRTRIAGRGDCGPVVWPVKEFRLVQSRPHERERRFVTLERWTLGV